MKSYTNLNQSRRLAEILSLESADMHYARAYFEGKQSDWFIGLGKPIKSDDIIPCWSLAALLSVLPTLDDRNAILCKDIRYNKWHICYHSTATLSIIDTERYDNPIDACYEMIIKLHEQKLL